MTLRRYPPAAAASLALALFFALAPIGRAADRKPELVAVCIGVSQYGHSVYNAGVRFAAKDAADVAAALRAQEGKQFRQVQCKLLTDGMATRRGIEEALEWLEATAGPDSCVIVYLAGHAGPDGVGAYRYVPYDGHPFLESTYLAGATLRAGLERVQGTRFLLLDTCFAGGASGPGAHFVTLAACTAKQTSKENSTLQNGMFTRALLEGLQGKASRDANNVVTLEALGIYVSQRLRELSNGQQQATLLRPVSVGAAFPLAMAGPAPGATAGLGRREAATHR